MKSKKPVIMLIATVLLVAAVTYSLTLDREANIYKVSYFPFSVHTYGAVDEEHIDEIACFIFEMNSKNIDKLYRKVLQSYKKSHEYEDYINIRTKLIRMNDGKVGYITQTKEVVYEGRQYDIDVKTIKAVVKDICEDSKRAKCQHEHPIDCELCESAVEFDEKLFGF